MLVSFAQLKNNGSRVFDLRLACTYQVVLSILYDHNHSDTYNSACSQIPTAGKLSDFLHISLHFLLLMRSVPLLCRLPTLVSLSVTASPGSRASHVVFVGKTDWLEFSEQSYEDA